MAAEKAFERHVIAGLSADEKRAAFLRELSALSEKYEIVIGSCGCCQSPFLEALTTEIRPIQYESDEDYYVKAKQT